MEKEKLKELIVEHTQKFLDRKGLVRREIQGEIGRFITQKEILLISGVRRSGKSSLMRLICDDILKKLSNAKPNILYLNFEDERFVDFTVHDFESLYETFLELKNPKGKKFLFFDEIQNVAGWEKWLNRLYEFEDVKIFISGSNASLLSSEISTALTGRNRQIVNLPFSFSEFLNFKGYETDKASFYLRENKIKLKRAFKEYLELGGFPEVIKSHDPTLLEQYYRDILYRDIIARYSIKNIKEIKELALFLAAHPGTLQSYKNLKNLIRVKSIVTIKNYLESLADVFLFYFIDMFDFSIRRQIYNPSKVYCVDTALSSSVSFKFSQNKGHMYENIVCIELLRRGHEVYYWKSKRSKEVDFIVKKGLKIDKAIQVSMSISDARTRQREIEGLMGAHEELRVKNLFIITDDQEGQEKIDKCEIQIIPLWKWLLVF